VAARSRHWQALAARRLQSRQAHADSPKRCPEQPVTSWPGRWKRRWRLRRHPVHGPVDRERATGQSSGTGPCTVSRPDPAAGHWLGHGARTSGGCGTAPGLGSDVSGPRPRAAADTGARSCLR